MDAAQRQKALDVTTSFIVQAPAGSGKTELLTQRFLALLSQAVSSPEEIIAITFTRKAAAEMRERILQALNFAKDKKAPSSAHAFKTWTLAKEVLQKDSAKNWGILQNPNRLRIFTIDSLCARIAKAAPLLSHFGSIPKVVEDAHQYYILASQSLLASLEDNQFYSDVLEQLLLHLDNNYLMIEKLFIGMLQRRDQWLPHVAGKNDMQLLRNKLETGLYHINLSALKKCHALMEKEHSDELLPLARYAAKQLMAIDAKESHIVHCQELTSLPPITLEALPQWLGIAELLLTKSYEFRRAVNKDIGFPSPSALKNNSEKLYLKEMKERMIHLLQSMQNESLRLALQEILLLPPPRYSEKQWAIIEALMILLPLLVAHLHVIFQENNVVDFSEVAQGAIQALGDFQAPSDLTLNLDYQISHILVDEFQDTSATQFHLLELLINGWSPLDGRTLFLVGDPMQSIYRFREADVGIFLKVKKLGIGPLKPESLTLHVNFRSEKGLIDWINNTFAPIFPQKEQMDCGAVTYNMSQAIHENSSEQNVFLCPLDDQLDEHAESQCLINVIKKAIAKNPEISIAILVRSRQHLQTIIPALKTAGILFQAIEIEKLKNCSVVQDLYALTKAICHLADRVAWLAILRAPWCGLTLLDLHNIANANRHGSIFETLIHLEDITSLTDDGQRRLQRVIPALQQALMNRRRASLRNTIAAIWYALGGPACVDYEYELENAQRFFQLLDEVDHSGDILNFELLATKLDNLYTHVSATHANVHIMTIHKAKGLEFDVIILPSLNKKPANEDNRLLLWCERNNPQNENDLILAPIKSLTDEFDPIYRFVRTQDNMKSRHEIVRLLYVAVTRAKKSLYLLYSTKSPESGSFLEILWPEIKALSTKDIATLSNDSEDSKKISRYIKRLALDWQNEVEFTLNNNCQKNSRFSYQWQTEYQQHVGSIIHQILQKISQEKLEDWHEKKLAAEQVIWQKKLLQLGVNKIFIPECREIITLAIKQTLEDERGCWILNSGHQDARSELAVTAVVADKIKHFIIDRTFIDATGNRWIIDYKTSCPTSGENVNAFISHAKKQHQEQLQSYAQTLKKLDPHHPIRIGLYFPLFKGWCEISWY